MYEDAAAYGAEGGGVGVEGAVEGFPSGKEGSDGGQVEKFEGCFGLWLVSSFGRDRGVGGWRLVWHL